MILGYTAEGVHLTMGASGRAQPIFYPTGEALDYSTTDRAPLRGDYWQDRK